MNERWQIFAFGVLPSNSTACRQWRDGKSPLLWHHTPFLSLSLLQSTAEGLHPLEMTVKADTN